MIKIETIRRHWIWAVLAGIISFVSLFWQYKSARHDFGGVLNATFHNRTLINSDSRTIIVCVDDTIQRDRDISITPTFDNEDEYSLRDFSLTYDIIAEDVKILPSEFVSVYNTRKNEVFFRYNQDVLQAHMDTKNPFSGFVMQKEIAKCEIVSKASFDGASSLFEYRTHVWFVYSPHLKNQSFDDWKFSCKQKVFKLSDDKSFDIYYFSNNNDPVYQFDVYPNEETQKKSSIVDKPNDLVTKLSDNHNYISLTLLSNDEVKDYAELKIKDYNIEPGDPSIINLFFDKPAKKGGSYVISFWIKDGWKTKTIYKHFFIEEGQNGASVEINKDINKIARLTLMFQVSINQNIEITKNYNGYFSAKSIFRPLPILCWSYDNYSYYIRPFSSIEYSTKFTQKAKIEFFNAPPNIYQKIFNFGYAENKYIFYIFSLVFIILFSILFYYSEEDKEIGPAVLLGWTFYVFFITCCLCLVLIYDFIDFAYYYISLMAF